KLNIVIQDSMDDSVWPEAVDFECPLPELGPKTLIRRSCSVRRAPLARPHDVYCADPNESRMRAAIPATRAQQISNALRVSPPHALRPMQRVALGPRLSWQHHRPGVEPEDTSRHRADFAVGDDTQHHGASGGALPRYNHLLAGCADDLVLVQELVDESATVMSDDDRCVGMCRKKTSPREEADQFLHVCVSVP